MSHDTPIRVEHIGIAVRDVDPAEAVFTALGATKYVDDTDPAGDFRWIGYKLGDASGLELITPLADRTFLTDFLDEHGPGLHHVTFEVADMDAVVAALEAADVPVVDRAEHDFYEEAFVSPRNPTGALLQLMRYKDGYEEVYGDGTDSPFVGGARVGDAVPGP
jgi:methylmalonyl-CoA/ethylmalonyl-CoA epimerase